MEIIHPKQRYSKSATRKTADLQKLDEVATRFAFDPTSTAIKTLDGGFKNGNFLVQDQQKKAVLRVSSTDSETIHRESALLKLVRSKGIKAPDCLDVRQIDGTTYALHSFVEGVTLEDYLLSKELVPPQLFFDLGSQLAMVHSIRFEQEGFFASDLTFAQTVLNTNEFVVGFMQKVLSEVSESRLPAQLNSRFMDLIESRWDEVRNSTRNGQLTHFDFNPKNIMVSENGELACILDWEFGMSANSLADLGNFFRFSYDYPEYAMMEFENGYRRVDPDLPENWREVSRLLDLAAMCGFLERKEEYPESFRTARNVIERTLCHFDNL